MKNIYILFLSFIAGNSLWSQNQNWSPVTTTTIVVSNDTFIDRIRPKNASNTGYGGRQFYICPGVRVYFLDSIFSSKDDTFLLDDGAILSFDTILTTSFKKRHNFIAGAPASHLNPDFKDMFMVYADSSFTHSRSVYSESLSKWQKNSAGEYYDFSLLPSGKNPCKTRTAGLSRITGYKATIFPNPASGSISIKGLNPSKEATYQLYDLNGKMLLNGSILSGETRIETGEMKGIYFLKIRTQGETQGIRIILY